MSGDRHCIECGQDLLRNYDPPIACEGCEVTKRYETEKVAPLRQEVLDLQNANGDLAVDIDRWKRMYIDMDRQRREALGMAREAHDDGYGIGYRNAVADVASGYDSDEDPGDSFDIWLGEREGRATGPFDPHCAIVGCSTAVHTVVTITEPEDDENGDPVSWSAWYCHSHSELVFVDDIKVVRLHDGQVGIVGAPGLEEAFARAIEKAREGALTTAELHDFVERMNAEHAPLVLTFDIGMERPPPPAEQRLVHGEPKPALGQRTLCDKCQVLWRNDCLASIEGDERKLCPPCRSIERDPVSSEQPREVTLPPASEYDPPPWTRYPVQFDEASTAGHCTFCGEREYHLETCEHLR